jgi:hypothetical protein
MLGKQGMAGGGNVTYLVALVFWHSSFPVTREKDQRNLDGRDGDISRRSITPFVVRRDFCTVHIWS